MRLSGHLRMLRAAALALMVLTSGLFVAGVWAQEAPNPITYDDVNVIARRMFCPDCENIPLDKCSTQVCLQWKQEIADRLAQGQSDDEIISYFVTNFGNRVVDIPQDPTLRTLAVVGPWLLGAAIILIGLTTLLRLLRPSIAVEPALSVPSTPPNDDSYRARLERDLEAG